MNFIIIASVIIVVAFIAWVGWKFFKDSRSYPDVKVGERFGDCGFDSNWIKLPNDYGIFIVYGERNEVYKIKDYEDELLDAIKIITNVEYYFWIDEMVFFITNNEKNETILFSLDTAGIIEENLTEYENETELLKAYEMKEIDWIKI